MRRAIMVDEPIAETPGIKKYVRSEKEKFIEEIRELLDTQSSGRDKEKAGLTQQYVDRVRLHAQLDCPAWTRRKE
jgi:predicted GIY-YIG superfamily endonuclease